LRPLANAVITFGSHKLQGMSGLAKDLLGSQEGIYSMALFSLLLLYGDIF
jgi:hypothetical protein